MITTNMIVNKIVGVGGYINRADAERYVELMGKHRTDEEEAEKNQIIKKAMTRADDD